MLRSRDRIPVLTKQLPLPVLYYDTYRTLNWPPWTFINLWSPKQFVSFCDISNIFWINRSDVCLVCLFLLVYACVCVQLCVRCIMFKCICVCICICACIFIHMCTCGRRNMDGCGIYMCINVLKNCHFY